MSVPFLCSEPRASARADSRRLGGIRLAKNWNVITSFVLAGWIPAILLAILGSTAADAEPPIRKLAPVPAEERRLDRTTFRKALKDRGLIELLELHLQDYPPTSDLESLLVERDLKLVVFADLSRSDDERAAALANANSILYRLIQDYPNDPRRFDWRFGLAKSLIYEEAQPLITSLLYRGGSAAEREQLGRLTTRAVSVLSSLIGGLAKEYDRVDHLSVVDFERLERTGYIEHIDRLEPRAEYLMLWALYYDSLPRADSDPVRGRQLNRVRTYLADHPAILATPHEESGVQIPAIVLAGLTDRLLHDYTSARRHFDRALAIADRLLDGRECESVQWAVTLAQVEGIRNDRDDGRFDAALVSLSGLRQDIATNRGGDFGLRLVAALLERSIHLARADVAEQAEQHADARLYRREAWVVLASLAERAPQRRDEIYATLHALNGANVDPAKLDPFEQSALIAGLLTDAGTGTAEGDSSLVRAVQVGEWFLAHSGPRAPELVPEVLHNLAVAQYRRGRMVDAARRFLEIARDHASCALARQSAAYAVQLTADLYADASLRAYPELQQLYRETLYVLLANHPETEAAKYWRFYYAQLLEESDELDQAAAQYALVHAEHEHFIEAAFSRVRCLAASFQRFIAANPADRLASDKRADEFFAVQRQFLLMVADQSSHAPTPERAAALKTLQARAKLLAAEMQVLAQIDRPHQALEMLADFEATYPSQTGLTARVWRVRLLAYERLGRVDDVTRAIPALIAADSAGAGPTLQEVYTSMAADVGRLRDRGESEAARRKAEVMLILADKLVAWGEQHRPTAPADEHGARVIQLGDANLEVGRFERARELYERYLPVPDAADLPEDPAELRALAGYAEAQFQLEEWEIALPRFNALAIGLSSSDPVRWHALLRDLQCRTALGHRPRDVIKVIEQQQRLYPDLGGPRFAPLFQKLQRENQRRLDSD